MKYETVEKILAEGPKNWVVRVYNDKEKEVDHWKILDRTENEATKEAEADVAKVPGYTDGWDWTMTEDTETDKMAKDLAPWANSLV